MEEVQTAHETELDFETKLSQTNSLMTNGEWKDATIENVSLLPTVNVLGMALDTEPYQQQTHKKEVFFETYDTYTIETTSEPIVSYGGFHSRPNGMNDYVSIDKFEDWALWNIDEDYDGPLYCVVESIEEFIEFIQSDIPYGFLPFPETDIPDNYSPEESEHNFHSSYYVIEFSHCKASGLLQSANLTKPQPITFDLPAETPHSLSKQLLETIYQNQSAEYPTVRNQLQIQYQYNNDTLDIRFPSQTEPTTIQKLLQKISRSDLWVSDSIALYGLLPLVILPLICSATTFVLSESIPMSLVSLVFSFLILSLLLENNSVTELLFDTFGYATVSNVTLKSSQPTVFSTFELGEHSQVTTTQETQNDILQTVTVQLSADKQTLKSLSDNPQSDEPIIWKIADETLATEDAKEFFVAYGWEKPKDEFISHMTKQPEHIPEDTPAIQDTTETWYLLPN